MIAQFLMTFEPFMRMAAIKLRKRSLCHVIVIIQIDILIRTCLTDLIVSYTMFGQLLQNFCKI